MSTAGGYKLLRKGKEVATVSAEFLPEEEEDDVIAAEADICEVSKTEDELRTEEITVPQHITDTFNNSTKHLISEEQVWLAALLSEHKDVFAKDEFDLGTFTEIQHGIDTQNAAPIKQRIRRTPACFVGEEETHLKKMTDAGVIQESTSEWASSLVLIRKRDGTVWGGA